MDNKYPEIKILQNICDEYNAGIEVSGSTFLDDIKDYPAIVLSLAGKTFNMFVEDEYNDFQIENPLLSLSLVLRELEIYKEEDDFLAWCKSQILSSSNSLVLNYYKTLDNIYNDIEMIMGSISNPISSWDFEMNSGAVQELRKSL